MTTLRTRLWLSYALLVGLVMAIIAAGLFFALARNPRLLFPDAVFRLRLVGEAAVEQLDPVFATDLRLTVNRQRVEQLLRRAAEAREIRAVLLGPEKTIIVDTGGAVLPLDRILQRGGSLTADQVRVIRSLTGVWIYTLQSFPGGYNLILTVKAPTLRAVFREEFVSTFLYAGLAAIGLSFLLALVLSRWISAPLARMVLASRAVARGEYPAVPVEGPGEVQELARALNEMSQQVQASQHSQRDFVANVSHELKTPLTSIQGFAQAILDGAVQTPEALQKAASVIYDEANRMHRLVLDLLSLARLEGGTADLERAPVDMGALLENVIDRFRQQAEAAGLSLTCEAAGPLSLTGDEDRLTQVFTNLVENAIKFTPRGGRVAISAVQVNGSVEVSVSDTGPGISAADLPRVFERFYQVEKSRPGGRMGVGLGLPIARQIVLAHGGLIWVESQPAQGSRFMVKLPIAKAVDPIQAPHTKPDR